MRPDQDDLNQEIRRHLALSFRNGSSAETNGWWEVKNPI
jgi:hypothetical protein